MLQEMEYSWLWMRRGSLEMTTLRRLWLSFRRRGLVGVKARARKEALNKVLYHIASLLLNLHFTGVRQLNP